MTQKRAAVKLDAPWRKPITIPVVKVKCVRCGHEYVRRKSDSQNCAKCHLNPLVKGPGKGWRRLLKKQE